LEDLVRLQLKFVNRERGSGTRLLLDALLAQLGIAATAIKGFNHEEFTHMATAATVRAGMADAAFGIEAAARAHGLRFIGLVTEHYYFACRRTTPARITLDTIIATAQSKAFARTVARIGGYDTTTTGSRAQLGELLGDQRQIVSPFHAGRSRPTARGGRMQARSKSSTSCTITLRQNTPAFARVCQNRLFPEACQLRLAELQTWTDASLFPSEVKRESHNVIVLDSIGSPAPELGVESFLALFVKWRENDGNSNLESCSTLPPIKQGPVRRIDRRTAARVG